MGQLLDPQNGIAGLLAGIIIVFSLNLVVQVGKFLFDIMKNKNKEAEATIQNLMVALKNNTDALQKIDTRMTCVERDLNEVLKFRIDFKRLFSAVKFIAGDKWPEAKKAMKDFELE